MSEQKIIEEESNMFGNFTEHAQKILTMSQEEASILGMRIVEAEHIALALMKDKSLNTAKKVLHVLGVDFQRFQSSIEEDFLMDRPEESHGNVSEFSTTARRIIQFSMDESKKLNHDKVGTEHILLGIVREGSNRVSVKLAEQNVVLNRVRQKVLSILDGTEKVQFIENETGMEEEINAQPQSETQKPTPYLDRFGVNLSKKAEEGEIDPVIGRATEIERTIEILSRRSKNNPILIGEPGVGKTAIAEGLALEIFNGNVPQKIKNKRVFSLELGVLVAGTRFRGDFEERLTGIINEVKQAKNIVLFMDEIHTLLGAGDAIGGMDGAQIVKPALARGELQTIGATTVAEYRKYFQKDAALARRFQPVQVDEPSVEESILILKGLKNLYEGFHGVEYTDEAIVQAVKMSKRYITDRFLPDKAIDLLDEAGAKLSLRKTKNSDILGDLLNKKEAIEEAKKQAQDDGDFTLSVNLLQQLKEVEEEIRIEKENLKQYQNSSQTVTESQIAHVVAKWTGIPVEKVTKEQARKVLRLEEALHNHVIGQHDAVVAISKAIRRAKGGLKNPKRPIGSFLFLGPTGVGKTELVKSLAQELFGDKDAMIRIDMSEYMEKFTYTKLIGSAPGYIGYEEGGQLTEKVKKKPFSVVLLDEIEKAHPEVFDLLLQVLDDGRLTDGQGRTVDFRNTVIVMTSNIGSQKLFGEKRLGFGTLDDSQEFQDIKSKVMDELKHKFRPEFLNRIDEKIVFQPLTKEDVRQILELMLKDISSRIEDLNITLHLTDEAKSQIAEEGYDKEMGARPLNRTLQNRVEDLLSDALLKEEIVAGNKVTIDYQNDAFFFTVA